MALAVGYVLFLFYKGRESTGRSRRDRGGPTNGMKDQGKTGWRSASPSNFACRAKRLRRLLAQRRAPCETATRANRQRSRHRIWSRSPMTRFRGELRRSEEHTSELQSLMRNSYAVY